MQNKNLNLAVNRNSALRKVGFNDHKTKLRDPIKP